MLGPEWLLALFVCVCVRIRMCMYVNRLFGSLRHIDEYIYISCRHKYRSVLIHITLIQLHIYTYTYIHLQAYSICWFLCTHVYTHT